MAGSLLAYYHYYTQVALLVLPILPTTITIATVPITIQNVYACAVRYIREKVLQTRH